MSKETVLAVEAAIEAHYRDTLDTDSMHDRTGAVVDWVVGYTVSSIIDIGEHDVVGYANDYLSAASNPNAQVTLAAWVADSIMDVLRPGVDDD